ncbi:MAG: formylglycine-generating enzyme family protein [Bacteroidia bacterium]|nr:formylglycine-generating enzyme family protein [Bacteroidia bacterium]
MTEQKDLYSETVNGFTFQMKKVEGGTFMMGDNNSRFSDEKPEHLVTIHTFYTGIFPVTQALWKAVMETADTPSYFKGEDRPVESVSWNDVVLGNKDKNIPGFLDKLNQLTGKNYRLPTEAEWEYAAKGGKLSKGCDYAGSNQLTAVGWYNENSHNETKPVGLKDPNELGLYDINGNVWEWCKDTWHDNYNGAPKYGSAWVDSITTRRIYRGGSWGSNEQKCRNANRRGFSPWSSGNALGFRLFCFF